MAGNGGGAGAVQPEPTAGLGAGGDEGLALAGAGQGDHLRGGGGQGLLIVGHQVRQQNHLRPLGAGRLGGIVEGAQVALVQVLQTGDVNPGPGGDTIPNLDDGGHRQGQVGAIKLQAQGTGMGRQAMQQQAGGGDEAIAALLLHAWQAREKLVRHVLTQSRLTQALPGHGQDLGFTRKGPAIGTQTGEAETHLCLVVDLAQVMPQPFDLQPFAVRGDHTPGDQVVQSRSPEHRLLATGVHGDIAAYGGGVLGGGVHGEDQPGCLSDLRHPTGDGAGAAVDAGVVALHFGQGAPLDRGDGVQFFSVDDGTPGVQGYRRTRISGAAAAGDEVQAALQAGADDGGDLGLRVRGDDDKGHLHPPVGGVGGMGDPRQATEIQGVAAGDALEGLAYLPPPALQRHQPGAKVADRPPGRQQ